MKNISRLKTVHFNSSDIVSSGPSVVSLSNQYQFLTSLLLLVRFGGGGLRATFGLTSVTGASGGAVVAAPIGVAALASVGIGWMFLSQH